MNKDSLVRDVWGLINIIPLKTRLECEEKGTDPSLIYGVELEIENTGGSNWVTEGFRSEADNSLRRSGCEYISYPMTFDNLVPCIENFFNSNPIRQGERNYSERCSVHVHANCLDLSLNKLGTVLMLYQTFERLLFNFVGGDRDRNIFCVPWSETTLGFQIVDAFANGTANVRQWQKYTALNLLPLQTQGTIEFRHMPGTCDVPKIVSWLEIIGRLFAFARANSFDSVKEEIISLNTTSNYKAFVTKVFGDHWDILYSDPLFSMVEDGVLQTKYTLLPKQDIKITFTNDDLRDIGISNNIWSDINFSAGATGLGSRTTTTTF